MTYEIKCGDKIAKSKKFPEALKIYNRFKKSDDWTRLYCIQDGCKRLMFVTSKILREGLK